MEIEEGRWGELEREREREKENGEQEIIKKINTG